MLLIEFDIIEARRNPEMNQRVSLIDALTPFKNDPSIFVAFVDDVGTLSNKTSARDWGAEVGRPLRNTSGFKLGITKRPPLPELPVGILAHPVKDVFSDIAAGRLGAEKSAFIIRATGKPIDLDTYDQSDFDRDSKRLDMNFVRTKVRRFGRAILDLAKRFAEKSAADRHGALGPDAPSSKAIAASPTLWNASLRSLGYDIIVDRQGVLSGKPIGLFLHSNAFQVIDFIQR